MTKKLIRYLSYLFLVGSMMFAISSMGATTQGFFSPKNFSALQKDPGVLFSSRNTCYLKSLLGAKDFDLFSQSMSLQTSEDDSPNFVAISGNVRGLFTIFEGFFRMSESGKIWIAYLFDNKVHYFTNDNATMKQAPKIMQDWSSRFQDAQWIYSPLIIKADSCK